MAQGSSEAPKDLMRWTRWPRLPGLKWLRVRASWLGSSASPGRCYDHDTEKGGQENRGERQESGRRQKQEREMERQERETEMGENNQERRQGWR